MPLRPPRSLDELTDLRLLSQWCRSTEVTPSTDSVGAGELKDNSVTTTKIASLAVTSAKLATDAVSTPKIAANAVDNEKLRDSAGTSVIGKATSGTGDPADITAGVDNTFLVRRSGALSFDALLDADIPSTIARDTEVTAAVSAHEAAADPHPTYLTAAEGNAAYQPLAAALARIYSGTGSPEGAVTAGVGSLYLRTDGGAGTSLYVKESGSGNTGWIGK